MRTVKRWFKSFFGSDVDFTANEYTKVLIAIIKAENKTVAFSELVMKTEFSENKVSKILMQMLDEDVIEVTIWE